MVGGTRISTLVTGMFLAWLRFSNGNLSEIAETLTTDQRDALKQFRQITLKLPTEEFMKTDPYLVRWLQAYDFDVQKTLSRFQKILEARKKENISGILREEFPLFIQEEYPLTISSYDRQGRPVVITAAGKFNLRRTSIKGQAELMHRFGIMLLELMEVHLYELQCNGSLSQKLLPQAVVIFDLTGTEVRNSGCFTCVSKIPKFMQMYGNYGDAVQQGFLINVPRLMEVILTTLISFLPPKIQQTVHVFGLDKTEWSEALLRQISFDQLPIVYGGGRVTPKYSKQDKSVWNWNNPSIDAIFREYRQTNVSHARNCTSKAKISKIEATSSGSILNPDISTEIPATEHRHRHHHGENIHSNDDEMSSKQASEAENKNHDDWFIDNSWIDEIDSSEEDSISSESAEADEDEYLRSTHDSGKQEKYLEHNNSLQSQFSHGHDVHNLNLCSILMAILAHLTLLSF